MSAPYRVNRLPEDDDQCGWIAALPPVALRPALDSAERADCAVVGAGFTGLATARRLAELRPQWRVIVVEAQRVGFGATGRSSGFVVDLVDFVTRMPPAQRARYVEVARLGIDMLRSLNAEHGFDCHWDETGWMRAAAGPAGLAFLEQCPRWMDEEGIEHRWLGRAEMEEVTGTDFYQAGIRLPGYPLVQPAALARGLAACLPANVEIFESSPVVALAGGASPRIETSRGSVMADRLFVAANGYSSALGILGRRVFPLHTFGSMTRALTPEEQEGLLGEREWGLLAMDPMGSTVRRTRDQRILIRNTVHYSPRLGTSPGLRQRMRANHRRSFLARFPQLAEVELEFTWSGLMGTSRNHQHWFGEVAQGVYSAAGYTGAGIATGTASGRLLAELALGVGSPALDAVRGLPRPTWMPPEPLRSWGGRWLVHRMNASADAYL